MKPENNSLWEGFEHILLFISLGVMATSLGLILHFFVDKWYPGTPTGIASYIGSALLYQAPLLRGYLAGLIVSYPLFSFFFLRTVNRIRKNPELKHLHSRKILIYATLVITFLIVIINTISLVYGFLGGNVTYNFVLHFLVTVGISGIIFGYYLNEVRGEIGTHV